MRKRIVGLLGCLLLAAGCASTQMTATWRNPTYAGAPPRKVLVVGLIPDQALNHQVEQQLAARLAGENIQAAPLFAYLPAGARAGKDQILDVARRNGFDSIIVSRFKGTTVSASYAAPGPWGFNDYWSAYGYGPGYYGGYGAGYVAPPPEEQMETSLFEVRTGVLIWTGSSATFPSGDANADVSQFVSTVIDNLNKQVLFG